MCLCVSGSRWPLLTSEGLVLPPGGTNQDCEHWEEGEAALKQLQLLAALIQRQVPGASSQNDHRQGPVRKRAEEPPKATVQLQHHDVHLLVL